MLPKMQRSRFVKKHSVQFVSGSGRPSAPFYFSDNKPHECSQTWQVVRSEFDQMMLDNAREHGVDIHEGVRVVEVLFDGDKGSGGSRIRPESGPDRDVPARVVGRRQRSARDPHEQVPPARVGSGAEQGRDLDLLGGCAPRHGARRGRHDGAPDGRQDGLVLVHNRSTKIS